jgi:hypothetical protein
VALAAAILLPHPAHAHAHPIVYVIMFGSLALSFIALVVALIMNGFVYAHIAREISPIPDRRFWQSIIADSTFLVLLLIQLKFLMVFRTVAWIAFFLFCAVVFIKCAIQVRRKGQEHP